MFRRMYWLCWGSCRLQEVRFNEDLFDEVEVVSACEYVKYYLKQPIMQTVICLSLACDDRMK